MRTLGSVLVQMDRMGANFFRTVDMIVSNLAAKPLVLTLPIGAEDNFEVRFGRLALSQTGCADALCRARTCADLTRTLLGSA